ncbi:1459_t:CDS:2 [Funneliformis geosporum]|uniref:1459_t:CDS:1 n=1 Tax=Funneliformis geosporum TaxID=1117311 RepID=A0A9W4SF12_9GLOM|nr:1459_t:CDS:2 [Funneliformis geosporum]
MLEKINDTKEVDRDEEYLILLESHNTNKNINQKSTALYCQTHIKKKKEDP